MPSASDYRDEALSRLDHRAFFEAHGLELRRINDQEYKFRCPFHDDREASANVNVTNGLWFCHACNFGGTPIDMLMRRDGLDYKAALTEVGRSAGMPEPGSRPRVNGHAPTNGHAGQAKPVEHHDGDACLPTNEKIQSWHEAALRNADLMRWFSEHRGFTRTTVDRWELGWDGQRVVIPVRNRDGVLRNVRRYKRDATSEHQKMIGITKHNDASLFPEQITDLDGLILVEGEWDMILMQQHGFESTLTVTSGAGIWKPHFTSLFAGKHVTVIYDNDDAGRNGAAAVARILAGVAASVAIVVIPGLPAKGDITDFFVEQARDIQELRQLIEDATPWAGKAQPTEMPVIDTTLGMASDARYQGQKVSMPVLVSGKAMTPYTVPARFTVSCDMGNKRLCSICPLQQVSGVREVTLSASDPKALRLINVTTTAQQTAMKELALAISSCNRPVIDVHEYANVEELRLIPELDTLEDKGDSEYVTRTGYLLGHGLRANRGYRVTGYAHPDPKSQSTVHLVDEAIPAQDNISSFAMTPQVREQLSIFAGPPDRKVEQIYDDLRRNVHRIQGRMDMQIAFDLVWHSAIAFYFNGAFVRRGWTEGMVVGDSGQAKSEMALALLAHYRLGERVQGEQASLAGLIGGLEKMGDTWILSWGKVPLNDKRLLIVDETQGLHSSQIEAMSDVRATGVAEIAKIRTERTNARCRIVWLANPSTGRPLAQYNQGVLALRDVFHKPEDIRRLDFALGVASGDVAYTIINQASDPPGPPTFSSDACRNLILWAWSRTPDQVVFTEKATEAILSHASEFGRRYHSSIPIVEPADQRLKLARLSTAMAARTFATDDGERLLVGQPHVDYVADWLHRIYNARAMSYGEYSIQMQAGESLESPERVWSELGTLDNSNTLVDFLRTARVFRKVELEEICGYTSDQAKGVLKMMSKLRLIRASSNGYVKQPAFIALLRDKQGADLELTGLPWEDGDSTDD